MSSWKDRLSSLEKSSDGPSQWMKEKPIEKSTYLADSSKALELLSLILKGKGRTYKSQKRVQTYIDEIFAKFDSVTLKDELALYEEFTRLGAKLTERQKLQRIHDKTVVGLGGKFSVGKSKFINSITGAHDLLPEAQNPTTSVTTYIVKGNDYTINANCFDGRTISLSEEALKALTHEFYETYKIGFIDFIESIMITRNDVATDESIVFLDTAGYTKYDGEMSQKYDVSDKTRALNQLTVTDYLIWLIDIQDGEITAEDIEFIDSLGINTPILIVFNKADIQTEENIRMILDKAKVTVENYMQTECFAITAYSAFQNREYGGNYIAEFLKMAAECEVRSNDIATEFRNVEEALKNNIIEARNEQNEMSKTIKEYIKKSQRIIEIYSLVTLWTERKQRADYFQYLLQWYKKKCILINAEVDRMVVGNRHE